ncbi:MAG: Na+/H+ antiporter NhaC family protein [Pirellulales bacterium]
MEHPFGIWSLVPPVLAIGLAMATRRVVLSLMCGVIVAGLIVSRGDLGAATFFVFETALWTELTSNDHLRVFAFTLLMGAMVGVVQVSGGMLGIVEKLAPLARSRRGGQLMTWLLGMLIFFDDYANTLLLGSTMRPVTDRLKISREKLAYLVDSTAAPVAGLALISTWIAGEIGYIEAGFEELGIRGGVDGFSVFVATIPYRFYVLLALLMVPLVALLGRDFGPMLRAERQAMSADRAGKVSPSSFDPPITNKELGPYHWTTAVIPILVVVAVTGGLILQTGAEKLRSLNAADASWFSLVAEGDLYLALVYGSLAGLAAAVVLAKVQSRLTSDEIRGGAFAGAKKMGAALMILWMAWSLSAATTEDHLGTGVYLAGMIEDSIPAVWMPTIAFLLASVVAFATGTSWGTMGLLMPLVIGVTYRMLVAESPSIEPTAPLLTATIGGVLAGAIFGDHCSPISDTTVLSSQASDCDHMRHVWTQLPYALLVGGVSVICGTIPVGFGLSVWIALPLAAAALVGCLFLLGRRVDST